MSTSDSQTIAFLGGTGGCALAALTRTLNHTSRPVRALARTPSKLRDALTAAGVPASTLDARLTIVSGSALDPTAVRQLLVPSPALLISGLGGTPKLQMSAWQPVTLDNARVCGDATAVVLEALAEADAKHTLVCVISTTGVSRFGRDVPLAMVPLYHWLLAVPHEDKKDMEVKLEQAAGKIGGFVVVRPSLLVDRPGKGVKSGKVRVGWEDAQGNGEPAVGYTIARDDVGDWIFEEVVKGGGEEWKERFVTLTE